MNGVALRRRCKNALASRLARLGWARGQFDQRAAFGRERAGLNARAGRHAFQTDQATVLCPQVFWGTSRLRVRRNAEITMTELAEGGNTQSASQRALSYPFQAGASRLAGLSWAQQYIWYVVNLPGNDQRLDLFINIKVRKPMPVDAAINALRRFTERNPTLRTRIIAGTGGRDRQEVVESGSIPLYVRDALHPVAYSEVTDYLPPVNGSSPIRALIVASSGRAQYVALRLHHVVTDGWGVRLLIKELEAELSGSTGHIQTEAAPVVKSSADRADFESSQVGQKMCKRALEYAAAQFSSCPQTMFPHSPLDPQKPRYWNVHLRSKALFMALAKLTTEARLMPSTPIIGTFAMIMASRASLPSAMIYVGSNNRFSKDWASCTGPLFQESLIKIPVSQALTCLDLLGSLNGEILRMYRYGQYDPFALQELIRRIEHDRGIRLDKVAASAMLNIFPMTTKVNGREFPSRAQLRTMTRFSRISRSPRAEIDNLAFFVDVITQGPETILASRVDTRIVLLQEAEAILFGMERLLCELASGDVPMEQISDLCPGISRGVDHQILQVDGSRISLPDCRAALNAHPSVRDSYIRLDDSGGRPSLTAYVHVSEPSLTPAQLHASVVAELPPHSLAMAPHRYRLYVSRPSVLDDVQEWDKADLVSMGHGRRGLQS